MAPRRETYTLQETAKILGLGRNVAYAAARSGELPAIRVGRRYLIPREALTRWMADAGARRTA